MSDAIDEFYAEQLLRKSKTTPLRERLRAFVEDHGDGEGFKRIRAEASDGEALSDLVIDDRDERL